MVGLQASQSADRGPLVYPLRVAFALANLHLSRVIRFDQFVIRPLGIKGVRVDEEPGRHWELRDRGIYVWRDTGLIHDRDLYVLQHNVMERLHLLLSFARGGYVPVLNTVIESRRVDSLWIQKGMIIRWDVARGYSTIYETEDQLEAFMEEAFPRMMNPLTPRLSAVRGSLFGVVEACNEESIETQFLHAWMAMESAVHYFTSSGYVISRSKFEKWVRPKIKTTIEGLAGAHAITNADTEAMIAKIPELNRAPITDAICNFLDEHGVPNDRAEVEDLKQKRDSITHTGVAEKPPPNLTEEWFDDYRQRLFEASWRLINFMRAALLHTLTDEPIRSQLRQAFLPDLYGKVG